MKTSTGGQTLRVSAIAVMVVLSFVLSACASKPTSPQGAAEVRGKLAILQDNPDLANSARVEIREAEEAVRIAEQPLSRKEDQGLGKHRVYMADQKVEIASAVAETRYAESQRALLGEERDQARLQARTLEADKARSDADRLRGDASRARSEADAVRLATAEAALLSAESSSAAAATRAAQSTADATIQAAELQRQIDELQAKATDRGLVVTLGDVLFETGSAELQSGGSNSLNKLVNFLNEYPAQRVLVEGHTDNVGNADFNQGLSQRRAESVRNYLVQQGIDSQRISTSGMGLTQPVASNDSAGGRLKNRRVEIVIEKPQLSSSMTTGMRQ